ncbi:MAG: signal peptidase I [Ruminococcus sp.]|nr:signal peptidase I [Ruminococcus sp.]
MKKTLTKILHIVVDVLIVAILIVSVFVLTLALTTRGNEGVPTIFGKAPIGVISDSMKGDKEDDFSKGDLIICDIVDQNKRPEFKKGDIITFAADVENDGIRDYVTHRIYKVTKDGKFITKGDNNSTYDQNKSNAVVFPEVAPTDVLAVYHGTKIEGLGAVLNYLQTPNGFFLCVLLPMIIFFLYQAVRVIINAMAYSKEKGILKAQQAMDEAGLTEEQKQRAIAEYLASQNGGEETAESEQEKSEAESPEKNESEENEPEENSENA